MKFVFLLFLLFTFKADAWMEEWAPKCKGASADVKMLSKKCVHHFITTIKNDDIDWILKNELGIGVTISTTFGSVNSYKAPLNRINRDLNYTSAGFLNLINGLFR